jgi:hypothetical protein
VKANTTTEANRRILNLSVSASESVCKYGVRVCATSVCFEDEEEKEGRTFLRV